jgi:hypothetical protein
VEGSLDGAPFSLYVAQASSDTGLLGVEEVVMALGVRGELPPGLHASRGGLLGDVESAVEGRAAAEGPPAFEARVRVVAHDPAEVPAFLTDRRRRALVRLMEVERSCLPQLKGARLELRDREMLSDLGRLEGRLRLLREVARNLGPEEG